MHLENGRRWTTDRVNEWWAARNWLCGFNFLPSTSVNFLEMWMGETFDRDAIDRELGWAAAVGFNSVRTNPHFLVWEHDRDGLMERLDWFLTTATKHGIITMPVLFDDCGFGGFEPVYGKQPDPATHIHNSRAVASPGRAALTDRAQWPSFKGYVQDVISTFGNDARILLWDLYNEPGNMSVFTQTGEQQEFDAAVKALSRDLMLECFEWAREIDPSQPLTVGAWRVADLEGGNLDFDNEIDRLALEHSDVITFHAYTSKERVNGMIDQLSAFDRPMMVTEWMARTLGSKFDDQLQLYKDRNVSCYNWGLVQGRTQTHFPWPHTLSDADKSDISQVGWFHDVFRPDGTPYKASETQLISDVTQAAK